MSKLTEASPAEFKASRRVFLLRTGDDIVLLQGARIIGKVCWVPKPAKSDAVEDEEAG
jgi:hypothetical protein